ncbi:MAG TPA: hypothetical protein VHA52_13865 [Candidatus Babeliaceae bacterium]|nr:hypothetical protein [Candidatus Babeliaceae bacterium]
MLSTVREVDIEADGTKKVRSKQSKTQTNYNKAKRQTEKEQQR